MAVVVAAVVLGAAPAACVGLAIVVLGWFRWRERPHVLLNNLLAFAAFPLLTGWAFAEARDALGLSNFDPGVLPPAVGAFFLALLLNFSIVAGYQCYVRRTSLLAQTRAALLPLLASDGASAVLAAATVYIYHKVGLSGLALVAVVIVTFQYLVGELLRSPATGPAGSRSRPSPTTSPAWATGGGSSADLEGASFPAPAAPICSLLSSTSTASSSTTTSAATRPATTCSPSSPGPSGAPSAGPGSAYRLGGDEFCVLLYDEDVRVDPRADRRPVRRGAGRGGRAACSRRRLLRPRAHPAEALTASATALQHRRPAHVRAEGPRARPRPRARPATSLLQVLSEQHPELHDHLRGWPSWPRRSPNGSASTRWTWPTWPGQPSCTTSASSRCPTRCSARPARSPTANGTLMYRHTIVGERIAAGRALRSSRWPRTCGPATSAGTATGYPDGLAGKEIPLAARIIAVCDAFHAICSRPPLPRRGHGRHRRGRVAAVRRRPVRCPRGRGARSRDRRLGRARGPRAACHTGGMTQNSFDARSTLRVGDREYEIFRPRRAAGEVRRRPAALLAEDPPREPAAQRGRRRRDRRGHRGPGARGTRRRRPRARSPSRPRACCCRTSPACPPSSTSPRCATPWPPRRRPGARSTRCMPVELVIDHSVQVDEFGTARRLRSATPSWSSSATASATSSCAGARAPSRTSASSRPTPASSTRSTSSTWRASSSRERPATDGSALAYPDTLVGTDSHTTMINGLGVLGWGVGGIEAEAAMLGQPVSMLVPQVVGFKLARRAARGRDGDRPRPHRHRDAARAAASSASSSSSSATASPTCPLADRATHRQHGARVRRDLRIFPVDAETLRYLAFTGRDPSARRARRGLRQGAGAVRHDERHRGRRCTPTRSSSTWRRRALPGRAKRPQDRVSLTEAKGAFRQALEDLVRPTEGEQDEAVEESFPASDSPANETTTAATRRAAAGRRPGRRARRRPTAPVRVARRDVRARPRLGRHRRDHQSARTPRTRRSWSPRACWPRRPSSAGWPRSPGSRPASPPGSKVVTEYLDEAGLSSRSRSSASTSSATAARPASATPGRCPRRSRRRSTRTTSSVCGGALGQPQLRGPHQPRRAHELPGLAAARRRLRAGRHASTSTCSTSRSATDTDGEDVFLNDIWPSAEEVARDRRARPCSADMFTKPYGDVFDGDERWNSLEVPEGDRFAWDEDSTYVRRPAVLRGPRRPSRATLTDIEGARVLACSATASPPTTSRRPARSSATARRAST